MNPNANTSTALGARHQRDAATPAIRRRLTPTIFGLVPEGAITRRPADVVALVVTTTVVVVTAWLSHHPRGFGRWSFEVASQLSDTVHDAFRVAYQVGCGVVVVALIAACIVGRRQRLALSMAAAAFVTTVVGLSLVALVDADTARRQAGLGAFGDPPDFPAVRLAVAVSVLLVVAPYLTRPARRAVYLVVLMSAASAVMAVEGLVTDVLGSFALGWMVAALVHLVIGSPAGRPTVGQVDEAMRDLGVEAGDLRLVPGPWPWTQLHARIPGDGTADVLVIGRDARDARVFTEVWRNTWYKGSGADVILTRHRQVEHWAYLLLLASWAGARVTPVIAAGNAGRRDDAVIVVRHLDGEPLDRIHPDRVTDRVLEDGWRQIRRLADARIAKGGIRMRDVVLTADGRVAFEDFSQASYPAPPARTATDAVDFLVASAGIVGVDRAVEVARRALGPDGFDELLPVLQPAALSHGARRETRDQKLVETLRSRAAAVTGQKPPELAELRRVSIGDVLMAAGTLVGIYLLIAQLAGLSDVADTLRSASWAWIALAAVLSQLPQIAAAFAMVGAVIAPLPLGPTIGVQYANNFTGLVGGTVANVALVVRFLQRQGQPAAVAVSSGMLTSIAGGIVQAVLLALTFVLSSSTFDYAGGEGSTTSKIVILAIAVGGAVAGILVVFPALRRRLSALVRPHWDTAKANVRDVLHRPRKAVQLFGGKLAVEVLYAVVLWASVQAYGGDISLAQAIFVNCAASLIGGAAPVPGGMGVVEAGLVAGLTAAGLDQSTALAATLTHRMLTAYLPPIWGWFSLAWLRKHEYV